MAFLGGDGNISDLDIGDDVHTIVSVLNATGCTFKMANFMLCELNLNLKSTKPEVVEDQEDNQQLLPSFLNSL